MCGIFGYYNFNVAKDREAILKLLINGLRRLEYRGYDSAGICVDTQAAYTPAQSSPQNGELSDSGYLSELIISVDLVIQEQLGCKLIKA